MEYLEARDDVNVVRDAADLSCANLYDSVPDMVVYPQDGWKIEGLAGLNDTQARALIRTTAQRWFDGGLRIIQLAYNHANNRSLHGIGNHFAGGRDELCNCTHGTGTCPPLAQVLKRNRGDLKDCWQSEINRHPSWTDTEPGLTKYGEWLARDLMALGVMLDVSHMGPVSTAQVLALSREIAAERGRPVPVLANHTGVRELYDWSRNKTLAEMCEIAATGGVIGASPVKTLHPPETVFLERKLIEGEGGDPDHYTPEFVDQFAEMRAYDCRRPDGSRIDLLDHVAIASDSGPDHFTDPQFFMDDDAASRTRWLELADFMYRERGFTLEEIRKIFGGNMLRALRAGLPGQYPFEPDACEMFSTVLRSGDFNGDGVDDLLMQSSTGRTALDRAEGSGHFGGTDFSRVRSGTPTPWCALRSTQDLWVGDFDGDGRDDLLCHNSFGRSYIDYANTSGNLWGTNWSRTTGDTDWCRISSSQKLLVADFNGDDRDDLLCHNSAGHSFIDYANSSGQFLGTNWSRSAPDTDDSWCRLSSSIELLTGDFNGDGRDDLLCSSRTNGKKWIDYASSTGKFTGTNWHRSSGWCYGSTATLLTGDVNGDGRDDLLCHYRSSGSVRVFKAESGRFEGSSFWKDFDFCQGSGQDVSIGEVNGDTRADMLCFDRDAATVEVLYGTPGAKLERVP